MTSPEKYSRNILIAPRGTSLSAVHKLPLIMSGSARGLPKTFGRTFSSPLLMQNFLCQCVFFF